MSQVSDIPEEIKEQSGYTYVDNGRLGRREGVELYRALCTDECLPGGDLLPSRLEAVVDAVEGERLRITKRHDPALNRRSETDVQRPYRAKHT